MIGAEILALVGILVGGVFGFRAVGAWAKAHKENTERRLLEEQEMRHAMHAALQAPGYEVIDIFLAEWGHALSKDERKRVEEIRTNRFLLDEKKP